jgi:hypothetical protein
MKNPSKVDKPNLTNPIKSNIGTNSPYQRYRRKLRQGIWG